MQRYLQGAGERGTVMDHFLALIELGDVELLERTEAFHLILKGGFVIVH